MSGPLLIEFAIELALAVYFTLLGFEVIPVQGKTPEEKAANKEKIAWAFPFLKIGGIILILFSIVRLAIGLSQ